MAGEDVLIRFASADEAERIAVVLRRAFGPLKNKYTSEAFNAVTPTADEIFSRFDEGPIWIVLKDGEDIGTVSVVPEPESLYIRSMAVLPTAQGLGVGRKLLDAVEDYATQNGFDRLFLYTTNFLSTAIRLYEKNGFKRVRETSADEWFGVPGLAMEKTIERKIKQNVVGS